MNWNNNESLIKAKTQHVRIQVDVVHNVQVRRIALGFSHEDLSFLLGRPNMYVYKIESFLHDKDYYATDLVKLFDILGCTGAELFESENMSYRRCSIGVYQYQDDSGSKVHETYLFENGSGLLLYRTIESIPRTKNLRVIKDYLVTEISKLIKNGFFEDGAEALDIFQLCEQNLKFEFRPIHLQNILRGFVQDADAPLLKKIMEDGRIFYIIHEPNL